MFQKGDSLMNNQILIVEDDPSLQHGIQFALKKEGYEVTIASTIAEGDEQLQAKQHHLILLDVNLPDGSGFDFCQKLRKTSDIPIIFLTARNTEIDVVVGLDLGGDDYITKPFRLRELISRVGAALRRSQHQEQKQKVLRTGDLSLFVDDMKFFLKEEEIPLSKTEWRLLKLLMEHPQQVLTKEQILEQLWGIDSSFIDENTIAVNISRIREKIEQDPRNPKYITTVRGAGYRWNDS